MLARVRGVFVLATLGACGFAPGGTIDGSIPSIDVFVAPDTATIHATWNVDPTSMKGLPESAVKWDELDQAYHLTTSAPDHLWSMQEASGGLIDTIGVATLSPINSPTYDNPIVGWSRHGVGTTSTPVNQGFLNTSIGNLDGTSHTLLLYVAVVAPSVDSRSVAGIGASLDHHYIEVTSMPTFDATGEGITPAKGTLNPGTAVHPLVFEIDATHTTYALYTDQEVLSPAWRAEGAMGSLVMVGNASIGSASLRYVYGTMWSGPHAEMSAAQVKAMLQALGWQVSGY